MMLQPAQVLGGAVHAYADTFSNRHIKDTHRNIYCRNNRCECRMVFKKVKSTVAMAVFCFFKYILIHT